MHRLKVGVLFGGCSEEHPVSVKSAQEVARNLDAERYEPLYVGITKGGVWKLCDRPDADWENADCRPATLSPDRGVHGLLVQEEGRYRAMRLDVVLPVLHGKLGEDGAVQGLLELAGIPYVGCEIQSSALCMDKSLTYLAVRAAGVPTPNFWTVTAGEDVDAASLPYPVFVKPARSGSSFGVTKVSAADELPDALETARRYDAKVLIEQAVHGSEIGCAVMGNGADLITGEVDQIRLSHGFFRIHQESNPESGSENSTILVPADIPEESRRRVQETARTIYRALGCRGLARVDTFLTEDGEVVLNEVNTMPGMTSYSRYPRMMAAAGLCLGEVLDRLLSLALGAEPIVREASAADALGVATLLEQLGYRRSADAVAAALDAHHESMFVAEREGRLVGLATLLVSPMLHRDRPVGRLTSFVVDVAARRRGVGGVLLDRVVDEARAAGCEGLELTSGVRPEREDAHRFYEGRGFRRRSHGFWLPLEAHEQRRPEAALPAGAARGTGDEG